MERDGGDGGRRFCRQQRRADEKWRCETGKGNSGCNKGRCSGRDRRGEEMRKRFDRERAVAECGLCGREIWPEEGFYQVNGEIFCRDCLERYAEQFFAGFFREGTV